MYTTNSLVSASSYTSISDLPSDCILLIGGYLSERHALDTLYSMCRSMRRRFLPEYLASAYGVAHTSWPAYAAQMRALATTFDYEGRSIGVPVRYNALIRHCILYGLTTALQVLVQYIMRNYGTFRSLDRRVNQWFKSAIITTFDHGQLAVLGRYLTEPTVVIDWRSLIDHACRRGRYHTAAMTILRMRPDCVNYISPVRFRDLSAGNSLLLCRTIIFSAQLDDDLRRQLLCASIYTRGLMKIVAAYVARNPTSNIAATAVETCIISGVPPLDVTYFIELLDLDPFLLTEWTLRRYLSTCATDELEKLKSRTRVLTPRITESIRQYIVDEYNMRKLDGDIYSLV